MKIEYQCGCKFDSNNPNDRKQFKYCFPDRCPNHDWADTKVLDAQEHGLYSMHLYI